MFRQAVMPPINCVATKVVIHLQIYSAVARAACLPAGGSNADLLGTVWPADCDFATESESLVAHPSCEAVRVLEQLIESEVRPLIRGRPRRVREEHPAGIFFKAREQEGPECRGKLTDVVSPSPSHRRTLTN